MNRFQYLPLPPEGGEPCESPDSLKDSLNRFARAYGGYRLVKQNAANYQNGRPTRYYLYCDHGNVGV